MSISFCFFCDYPVWTTVGTISRRPWTFREAPFVILRAARMASGIFDLFHFRGFCRGQVSGWLRKDIPNILAIFSDEDRVVKSIKFYWSGRGVSVAVLLVWATAVSVPMTFLMAGHTLPLPLVPASPGVTMAKPGDGRWQAVHILVADCPCSESVARYLAQRGPRKELNEQVWLLGGTAAWESPLEQAGFQVEHRDAEGVAAQLGIEGGPWLRLISPAGVVAYSGGYAPRRPGRATEICDLALWQAVAHGQAVEPYPAYGCAASRWLRQTIDPLGIKYSRATTGQEEEPSKNE